MTALAMHQHRATASGVYRCDTLHSNQLFDPQDICSNLKPDSTSDRAPTPHGATRHSLHTLMFILKMLRVTPEGVVPIAINPGLPATFFMCSCSQSVGASVQAQSRAQLKPQLTCSSFLASSCFVSYGSSM